jgi:Endonuclease NucS
MQKDQVQQLFNAFLSRYDAEAKDGTWAKQSQQFRDFWSDQILSRGQGELDDADIDRIVRILDKHGKGNTRDSEAVAKAMVAQGAWRRMFNDIKARKELSSTINSIFLEQDLDKKAALINKLYEVNAGRRNNLTGQSGNALNAMLAAFDPTNNASVISLKDRRMLYELLELGTIPDFDSKDIGKKIVLSNKGILDYFAALGPRHSARTVSVFFYSPEFKPLWKPEKGSEEPDPPAPVPVLQEVTDPSLFYMESQLEDFLIENWDKTELGAKYSLIEEDGELVSQQFRTSIGIIDILARDKSSGQYVVIELKKSQTSDDTVGQLTRYMGWLEAHKSGGQPTKGIIIAGQYDERLYYALRKLKDAEVYLYQVDFKLKEFKR